MKLHPLPLAAAFVVAVSLSLHAAKLGDPAAPLSIKEWVQGKAVDVKDGKNIYVVEFWATWCGPCRTSIPHLTKLQSKFKDKGVVFVGISDEDAATVKPFVAKMGKDMDYIVGCDDDRKSNAGYMKAYGQGGIPTAFIVGKEGKVLWFGHPMAELEETLTQIVAGKYDISTAAKKDESRARMDEFTKLSSAGDSKAKELGRQILADAGNDVDVLCNFAFGIAANARNKNRDFALAEEALDLADKAAGRSHQTVGIRAIALFEAGKQDEGLKLANEALGLAKEEKDKARCKQFISVMESRMKQKKDSK